MLEALPEDSDIPVFTLQGRLGRVSFWGVTTHLGLAFGQPNAAFHVSNKSTSAVAMWYVCSHCK